jgi:hypothetical protein
VARAGGEDWSRCLPVCCAYADSVRAVAAQGASAAASVTIDWRALRHCAYFYASKAAAALYRLRAGRAREQQDASAGAESAEIGTAGHERRSGAADTADAAAAAAPLHTCVACQLAPPEVRRSAALYVLQLACVSDSDSSELCFPRCCRCPTRSSAGTCTAIFARTPCCTRLPAQAFTAGQSAGRRGPGRGPVACSATSG